VRQKFLISSFLLFFLTLIVNLIHLKEKTFLIISQHKLVGKKFFSYLKSNDPIVITIDYDAF